MIKVYLFKTLISFVSLKAAFFITYYNWMKLNPKKNGFIKSNLQSLCMCLIPVIRWIWVIGALLIGIALGNAEFYEKVKEDLESSDSND